MISFFIILFAMLVLETIVGFGSTSIGIPILSLILGTERSINLLATTGFVLCLLIFTTQLRKINWREFLIMAVCVLPLLPLGYLLYAWIRPFEWLLRLTTGSVVTLVAGHELWRRLIRRDDSDLPAWVAYTSLALGALVEAMFSMGGPLVNVYALTRIKNKSVFRATMSAVWVMTISLSIAFRVFYLRAYTESTWLWILYALPLVVLAFLLGNRLHYKVPDQRFTIIVYAVQLIGGLFSIGGGIFLLL
ncbi:MAG: TSUP family transporter [Saccharofermentanales bacterium]